MTCIAGLVHKNHVYIGGDSAGVDETFGITVRRDKKVFIVDKFVFGFTDSFRMGQLLKYSFKSPEPIKLGESVEKYMNTKFIDAVRKCLKRGGFAKKSDNVEEGGEFLVGFHGRLFHIESDFQVAEPEDNYDACGCGQDFALGSLFSSGTVLQPEVRINLALATAEKFSCGVRGPFHIESI